MVRKQLILVAIGGNLPLKGEEPTTLVVKSVEALQEKGLQIKAVSSFYRTPCFPAGAGPDYVNAAVALQTNLDADAVLELLHRVEEAFGRERHARWAGRTLDLDLIAYGDQIHPDVVTQGQWVSLPLDDQMRLAPDQLILPHPRLQDRGFVLIPLMDIAPDWIHPVLRKSVAEMREELPEDQVSGITRL